MSSGSTLSERFERSAREHPERTAIRGPGGGELTYGELERLSRRVRDRLLDLGVRPGDRVGIHLRKSVDSVAVLLGTMRAGAAYVPVDADAPLARCAYILADCSVRVVVTERGPDEELLEALGALGASPELLPVEGPSDGTGLAVALDSLPRDFPAPEEAGGIAGDGLAYILYTSGSTGRPKGVRIAHRAALSFIDWCVGEFSPKANDVYSSHAPLHFDLSIHDIFVPLFSGAKVVLIDEATGKDPLALANLISGERISVWYSTPSILNLLALRGKLAGRDFSDLRLVLFAGEVFPIPQLRALKEHWPHPDYYNLYGPTETNVCTFFELPDVIPDDRAAPFPIGRMCPPLEGRVVDPEGRSVPVGEQGELVVYGPGVMEGYWNLPDQDERAFVVESDGSRWYRTGDLVVEDDDGIYVFHGRRDRMVKRRGYRVELGEIEAGLAEHPDVAEVAVVARNDEDHNVRIKAFIVLSGEARPSIIAMKRFAASHLPRYMVPDVFEFLERLPRTSTDKTDYRALSA